MIFRRTLTVALMGGIAVLSGCAPTPPPTSPVPTSPAPQCRVVSDTGNSLSVMGPPRVDATTMAAWYASKFAHSTPPDYDIISVSGLAQLYLSEGCDEGVRGDMAFVQAMVETGWLRFSPRVPATFNNFAGIGAVDGGTTAAKFPSPRIGVRAQIQHLRSYADSRVTAGRLAHPLVDPRFNLVVPKGKATSWASFGSGIWATDPDYADKIERLYSELRAFDR